jgi:hypothetical protein
LDQVAAARPLLGGQHPGIDPVADGVAVDPELFGQIIDLGLIDHDAVASSHENHNRHPGFSLQFPQQIDRGKLMQGKVVDLIGGQVIRGAQPDLAGCSALLWSGINHDQHGGPQFRKHQVVKQMLTDGGANVHSLHRGRQTGAEQLLNHRRPKTVVSEQDIAATKDGYDRHDFFTFPVVRDVHSVANMTSLDQGMQA